MIFEGNPEAESLGEVILAEISNGANLATISKKLMGIGENKVIIGFNCDASE